MKTVIEINKEIESVISYCDVNKKTLSVAKLNKERKRLEFLRFVKKYIETNPSKEFVESEIKRHKEYLKQRGNAAHFNSWKTSNAETGSDAKKMRSKYLKEMNVAHIKKQVQILEFINQ